MNITTLIAGSATLIIFLVNRRAIFGLTGEAALSALDVSALIAAVVCFLAVIISIIAEFVIKNRKKPDKEKSVDFSFDEITALAEKCDIISITAEKENSTVELGTTSDSYAASKLFDKKFYIEDEYFDTVSDFEKALEKSFKEKFVKVISIDGTSPYDYKSRLKI